MIEEDPVGGAPDGERLRRWLTSEMGEPVDSVAVTKLAGGHSSGAWRLDLSVGGRSEQLVLKAPHGQSVVHQRDAAREGRIVDALHRAGAPVPRVIGIDDGARSIGRACFVMELVDGRSPDDSSTSGYHEDPTLRALDPAEQRTLWEGFYDRLAALHRVDPSLVPDARLGEGGLAAVAGYWRAALLDVTAADAVPRQLAALDWVEANLPAGADDELAVCMGDARLVNCLFRGVDAVALVDFEVAYLGHPAADVGYSCFFDESQRASGTPLEGVGTTEEAWARWGAATGRDVTDREYWTAFGAMVLCVTATRAMFQWGFGGPNIENDNPVVPAWEAAIEAVPGR